MATNQLDMAMAESARSALFFHICALKDVKDSVCKWYPSLEVEVPAALLLHVTRYSIFSNSSIILPGLQASIGVTRSYSSCALECAYYLFNLQCGSPTHSLAMSAQVHRMCAWRTEL